MSIHPEGILIGAVLVVIGIAGLLSKNFISPDFDPTDVPLAKKYGKILALFLILGGATLFVFAFFK